MQCLIKSLTFLLKREARERCLGHVGDSARQLRAVYVIDDRKYVIVSGVSGVRKAGPDLSTFKASFYLSNEIILPRHRVFYLC